MWKIIRLLGVCICLLGMSYLTSVAQCMHPFAQIAYVKEQIKQQEEPYYSAYKQLLHYADSIQEAVQHAKVDFAVPGYYVKPKEHRANSLALQQDAFAAYCSALAYRLSGEKRYGEKACYFMNAWATINKKYSEPDGPLVMSYSGSALLIAAELMKNEPLWSVEEKSQFQYWVITVYQKATNEIRLRKNNWADWGRFGSLLAASFLDDPKEVARNVELVKSDLWNKIASDGHMPEEVVREANGIWYTYFSLAPLTASCWLIYNLTGENLFVWEHEGKSIKKALDYLLYYQKHPSQWKWYTTPNTGSHALWPDNLLEAMNGIYEDSSYVDYVKNSRPHIYPVHHFAWTFPTLMPLSITTAVGEDKDLEKLRALFKKQALTPSVDEDRVRQLVETIRLDGTWPGIDYVDTSRVAFQHVRHLNHLVDLARAYRKEGSLLQGDKKVKQTFDLALGYWLKHDFICENWWNNEIGTPSSFITMLLIMDESLSRKQVEEMLPIARRANLNAWGARPSGDRIKIAGLQAECALFCRDAKQLAYVIKVIEGEMKFSSSQERGIQYDYSFHHRIDRVNNTLSYGLSYVSAFSEWAANVKDTRFHFSEERIRQAINYYLDGICKQMVYGRTEDPNIKNRDVSRPERGGYASPVIPERFLTISDYRKEELETIVKARKGEPFTPSSFAKFFWQTEHFVFQRPDFYTSVRMFSTRNRNMEEPYNGEGLMNHFKADGANYLSITGKEYLNIAPVFDWMHVPGTTSLILKQMPLENEIQKEGKTSFVGAVADNKYGAVAFDFVSPHHPLQAKKGWFFFDDVYVCLGAGIHSSTNYPVVTTINQCYQKGNVWVKGIGNAKSLTNKKLYTSDARWVLHDQVGYLFPYVQDVCISAHTSSGSWFKVNRQTTTSKKEISADIFMLYLNHDKHPMDATYAYLVIPKANAQKLDAYVQDPEIQILSNTAKLQAVEHSKEGIIYGIFYQEGILSFKKDKTCIQMETPGIVMLRKNAKGSITALSVADPSRQLKQLKLSISGKLQNFSNSERIQFQYDATSNQTHLSITLPEGEYAGSSVQILINKSK